MITLPPESDADLVANPVSKTCKLMTGTTEGKSLTCTTDIANKKITVDTFCEGGQACTAGTKIEFKLFSDFIRNQKWVKSPLVTTDTFQIRTTTADGLYYIDGMLTGLVTTPTLIPDTLSFPSPQFSRSSDVVDAKIEMTTYVKIGPVNNVPTDGKLVITFP